MYHILNLDFFAETIRKGVLRNNGLAEDEELITNDQVVELSVAELVVDDGEYMASDEIVSKIIDEVHSIVIGVLLSKMAADGELETTWDSEKNEPVFWRKT